VLFPGPTRAPEPTKGDPRLVNPNPEDPNKPKEPTRRPRWPGRGQ
jgi:hypothetical protein